MKKELEAVKKELSSSKKETKRLEKKLKKTRSKLAEVKESHERLEDGIPSGNLVELPGTSPKGWPLGRPSGMTSPMEGRSGNNNAMKELERPDVSPKGWPLGWPSGSTPFRDCGKSDISKARVVNPGHAQPSVIGPAKSGMAGEAVTPRRSQDARQMDQQMPGADSQPWTMVQRRRNEKVLPVEFLASRQEYGPATLDRVKEQPSCWKRPCAKGPAFVPWTRNSYSPGMIRDRVPMATLV